MGKLVGIADSLGSSDVGRTIDADTDRLYKTGQETGRHGQTEEQIDGTGGWVDKQTDQFEWLKTA